MRAKHQIRSNLRNRHPPCRNYPLLQRMQRNLGWHSLQSYNQGAIMFHWLFCWKNDTWYRNPYATKTCANCACPTMFAMCAQCDRQYRPAFTIGLASQPNPQIPTILDTTKPTQPTNPESRAIRALKAIPAGIYVVYLLVGIGIGMDLMRHWLTYCNTNFLPIGTEATGVLGILIGCYIYAGFGKMILYPPKDGQ